MHHKILYKCTCGSVKLMRVEIAKKATSCGYCFKLKHGMTGSKTYAAWTNMRYRCNNPEAPAYADYGGRGIKVCAEWDSFEQFFKDMGSSNQTLERRDNDKGYSKDNCYWATYEQQSNNRRNNVTKRVQARICPSTYRSVRAT